MRCYILASYPSRCAYDMIQSYKIANRVPLETKESVLKEGKSKKSNNMTTKDMKVQISFGNDVISGAEMEAQVMLSRQPISNIDRGHAHATVGHCQRNLDDDDHDCSNDDNDSHCHYSHLNSERGRFQFVRLDLLATKQGIWDMHDD
ncbi:hypothetical protein CR513_33878, partial [Mucuna pruriens]